MTYPIEGGANDM